MTCRMLVASLNALAATSLAACSHQQKEPTSQVFERASAVREGAVASFDENRITLIDPDAPESPAQVIELTEQTTYVSEGDFVDPQVLSEGQAVRVFYQEPAAGAQAEALRIEILSGEEEEQLEERLEDRGFEGYP